MSIAFLKHAQRVASGKRAAPASPSATARDPAADGGAEEGQAPSYGESLLGSTTHEDTLLPNWGASVDGEVASQAALDAVDRCKRALSNVSATTVVCVCRGGGGGGGAVPAPPPGPVPPKT